MHIFNNDTNDTIRFSKDSPQILMKAVFYSTNTVLLLFDILYSDQVT